DAEAVGTQPDRRHRGDVLGVAAVVVARDIAGVAVQDRARSMREAMPVARARAVGERRTLDLICRRRGAPQEPLRERARRALRLSAHARGTRTTTEQRPPGAITGRTLPSRSRPSTLTRSGPFATFASMS